VLRNFYRDEDQKKLGAFSQGANGRLVLYLHFFQGQKRSDGWFCFWT
jgi:hypothetical protein